MNARQKAKRYKRMYEALSAKSKPPIEFKEEEYKIDTLKFTTAFSEEFVSQADYNYLREVVINSFAEKLVKCGDKYIEYRLEHLPYLKEYLIHLQMKVLIKPPHGNCMMCGKKLTDGIFLCEECREKPESEVNNDNNNA
jgi:hypothetical protein